MAKKTYLVLILAIAAAALLMAPGLALANWGIHGGYLGDTDACAGCHRAHTSVSSITWTDSEQNQQSALLASNATKMLDFCYACHDSQSQGAETNVQDGQYRGTQYGTAFGALNGGGFDSYKGKASTSNHMVEWDGVNVGKWGAYGGGPAGVPATLTADELSVEASGNVGNADYMLGAGNYIPMDCTACHDPHGSSNYRILKDQVNGNTVGGYAGNFASDPDPNPTPYVMSTEVGYPVNGFRLHVANGSDGYTPDYTTPHYSKPVDGDPAKGMSGWCAGCHTTYMTQESTYNAGGMETNQFGEANGATFRHRHPINSELGNFKGARAVLTNSGLPLAHDTSEKGATQTNSTSDWIECLTCHVAHGTSVAMTGYAGADSTNPYWTDEFGVQNNLTVTGNDSALLRYPNRGVCERCHNK